MPNIGAVIRNKNNQVLKGEQNLPPPCNCIPGQCPVDGKCGTQGVIYQATVETRNGEKFKYVGLSGGSFITRFQKHSSSFRIHDPRNSTTLSKKVLELQRNHILFDITWKILQVASPYRVCSRQYSLCSLEIYYILYQPSEASLNSRQEIANKCRHQNKFKLSNIK